MARAVFRGRVLAESGDTVLVEGNHYFPRASLDEASFIASATHTVCPWKGRADYLSVQVGDAVAHDAAWTYPEPKPRAEAIRDRVAFGSDVEVEI
jgi:uncharacterized protein (DUF427 family)